MRGYYRDSVLSPLFKLCEATLELIVPLIIAGIIDTGIKNGDGSYIFSRFLILVFLGALGLVFSVVAQYFAARASSGYVKQVRFGLFSHIQRLSYTELDKIGTSTLITRMSADLNSVRTGLNLALRLLLRSPFVVFGAMIMAFTIDVKSALIFALVIFLLAIVVYGIMLISMPLHKRTQLKLDEVVLATKENLEGVRVLRAFSKEETERERFSKRVFDLEGAQKRVGRISALLNPLTFIIINLGLVYLIYTGALRVDAGELSTGQVVALYNYMSQILVELIKLANLVVTITKALASQRRVFAVLDIETEGELGDGELEFNTDTAIEFKEVSFKYAGAKENSLSGVSFKIPRGGTLGIIGATGSGKSTLINLIPALYEPTGGEIFIDSKNIKEYKREALNEKIAVVFQNLTLFSGTIRENLCLGRKATDEELWRALSLAAADGIVRDKGGLDAVITEGGKNLSGGQKQRLTIARALVMNPDILILDDATSALDYKTDLEVRRGIKNFKENLTTVIVSQRPSSIMDADLILTLEDGEISGAGTHEELLTSSDVYREIYESQMGGDDE